MWCSLIKKIAIIGGIVAIVLISIGISFSENDTQNEHLLWLENITIPPGLSSVQIETHLKLQEEYKKIAEQIRKQERQLKIIKKLIEWSSLLLDLDRNVGVFGGESSVDSEAWSSVTSELSHR